MKLRNKLFSMVLAIALVVQLAPTMAFAAVPKSVGGALLELTSDNVTGIGSALNGTAGYDTFVVNIPTLSDSNTVCTLNSFEIDKDVLFIVDPAASTFDVAYDEAGSKYYVAVTQGANTLKINLGGPVRPATEQEAYRLQLIGRINRIGAKTDEAFSKPWIKATTVNGSAPNGSTYTVTQTEAGPVLFVDASRYDQTANGLTYQWYSKPSGGSESAVGGANAASCTVPTTNLFNQTQYYCKVTADGKTVVSDAITVTVAAPSCTYTATIAPVTITPKGGTPGASATIDILNYTDKSAKVAHSFNVTSTGTCNITNHTNHGYTASWSVNPNDGGVIINSDGTLSIDNSKIDTSPKNYTITATASRSLPVGTSDVSASVTLTLTRADCGKAVSGLTQKAGSNPVIAIATTDSGPSTFEYPLDVTLSGSCYAGHTDTVSGHGLSINWAVANADGTALGADTGISVTPKSGDSTVGVLSLDKAKLSTTARQIKITASANGKSYSWTVSVSRQRTDCAVKVVGLTQKAGSTPSTAIVTTVSGPNTFEYPLDVALSGECFAGHTSNTAQGHGRTIAWTVTNADGTALEATAGISVAAKAGDSSVGVLTLEKDKLPGTPRSIKITAAADGIIYSQTVSVSRQRTDCTVVVDSLRQKTGTHPTLNVTTSGSSGTSTFEYAVDYTLKGDCYAGHTPNTPAGHHRTIAWYVTDDRGNSLSTSSGITIAPKSGDSTVGVLTLERSKISRRTQVLNITATADGKSHYWTITVKRTDGSGSGSSSSSSDWYDFEDEIESAKTGSTISINVGSDTDMPATIFSDIRGINKTLSIRISGGYTWTVNGKTVQKIPAYQIFIPLAVDEISDSKISKLAKQNDIVILDFQNEGTFYADMKLSVPLGSTYANKTVYLYKYNESAGTLSYRSSVKADDSGNATFPFTSASTYVVTSKALSSGDGAVTKPSSSSTWTPPASSSSSSSVAPSSSSSSSSSSEPESSISSEPESSQPTIAEPDSKPEEKPETTKKKVPILVPILLVVIAVVILAVIFLSRGGFGKRYDD